MNARKYQQTLDENIGLQTQNETITVDYKGRGFEPSTEEIKEEFKRHTSVDIRGT